MMMPGDGPINPPMMSDGEYIQRLKKLAETKGPGEEIGKSICYHGTDANAARRIFQSGFYVGTWFSTGLGTAIAQGGPHIFEVAFNNIPQDERGRDSWQFHIAAAIPAKRIIRYRIFQVTTVFENRQLRHEVFVSNLP